MEKSKRKLLESRLEECRVSMDEFMSGIDAIVKTMSGLTSYDLYVYISKFDQIGNKDSDFDIYVIDRSFNEDRTTINIKISDAKCDIEFWKEDSLLRIIAKEERELEELKILKRISSGLRLRKSDVYHGYSYSLLKVDVDQEIRAYYKKLVNAEYDDATKMFKNGELISSLFCCYRAVNHLLGFINAQNGTSVCNLKWLEKIFLECTPTDSRLRDEYLNSFVYVSIREDSIETVVERMLLFISENVNSIGLNLWNS